MIIKLATSPTVLRMEHQAATDYLNQVKRWCFTNLGSPGGRWQVTFSPERAGEYGSLPLELIIPDEHDALLVRLTFGL